jgi:hypothetical protein
VPCKENAVFDAMTPGDWVSLCLFGLAGMLALAVILKFGPSTLRRRGPTKP